MPGRVGWCILAGHRMAARTGGLPGGNSHDELTLLNMAASMVDGVYQDIYEALKPGVRENEIVALATRG